MTENRWRMYECIIVTRQNFLQNNKPDDLLSKVAGILGENGTIVNHEYWGLRNFSYVIRRKRRGHYVLIYINTDASCMNEMKRRLALDDNILRFMIFGVEQMPASSSPLRQDYDETLDEGGAVEEGSRSTSSPPTS